MSDVTIITPEDFVGKKGVLTRYANKTLRTDYYGTIKLTTTKLPDDFQRRNMGRLHVGETYHRVFRSFSNKQLGTGDISNLSVLIYLGWAGSTKKYYFYDQTNDGYEEISWVKEREIEPLEL